MQHRVPLGQLPSGVEFPAQLRERIEYDPDRRELIFRGFMTKYTYDELAQLAKDVPYRDALERLFVLSSEEVQRPTPRRPPVVAIAGAVASLLVLALFVWAAFFRQAPPPPAAGPDALQTVGR